VGGCEPKVLVGCDEPKILAGGSLAPCCDVGFPNKLLGGVKFGVFWEAKGLVVVVVPPKSGVGPPLVGAGFCPGGGLLFGILNKFP
jgi:hypothetical protein